MIQRGTPFNLKTLGICKISTMEHHEVPVIIMLRITNLCSNAFSFNRCWSRRRWSDAKGRSYYIVVMAFFVLFSHDYPMSFGTIRGFLMISDDFSELTDLNQLGFASFFHAMSFPSLRWKPRWKSKPLAGGMTSFTVYTPGNLTWNLKITCLKRKIIGTKPSIFGVQNVNF